MHVCVCMSLYVKCLSSLLFHYFNYCIHLLSTGHMINLISGNGVYMHAFLSCMCMYVFV